jgi:hypothetical protein
VRRFHLHLAAQNRRQVVDVHFGVEVVAFAFEARVGRKFDAQ